MPQGRAKTVEDNPDYRAPDVERMIEGEDYQKYNRTACPWYRKDGRDACRECALLRPPIEQMCHERPIAFPKALDDFLFKAERDSSKPLVMLPSDTPVELVDKLAKKGLMTGAEILQQIKLDTPQKKKILGRHIDSETNEAWSDYLRSIGQGKE